MRELKIILTHCNKDNKYNKGCPYFHYRTLYAPRRIRFYCSHPIVIRNDFIDSNYEWKRITTEKYLETESHLNIKRKLIKIPKWCPLQII